MLFGWSLLSLKAIAYCLEDWIRQNPSRVKWSWILIGWFYPGAFGSHVNVRRKTKHPNASTSVWKFGYDLRTFGRKQKTMSSHPKIRMKWGWALVTWCTLAAFSNNLIFCSLEMSFFSIALKMRNFENTELSWRFSIRRLVLWNRAASTD